MLAISARSLFTVTKRQAVGNRLEQTDKAWARAPPESVPLVQR